MKHTKASEESLPKFLFRLVWSTFAGILIVMPTFVVLYILNDILRAIVNFRLKRKYGPKTRVLEKGSDAVWLYKVHNGKRLILYLAINDDPMDLERHRQNYADKVLSRPQYQKLKDIFTVDFSFNIQKYDVNFDVRNHVKILEGTEDRIITEEELMETWFPQLSEEMDDSKPQWEDLIIPHFKYDKNDEKVRSARVFRVHHAYMDGGSNLSMIADTQYEGVDGFPYVVDPMAPPKIALWKRALYKFNCFLLFGWLVIHGLYAPASQNVRNRFRTPTLSGKTNYAWSKPIPMDKLKEIKDSSGQSMPTILMSVLGGAIRKLNVRFPPKQQNVHPASPENKTCTKTKTMDSPDEIMVGMVAGIFPYPDLKLRNRHSIFHVKIDVSDKSPASRLNESGYTMKKAMWDPHVYLNLFIPELFGRTPVWFSDACMRVVCFPLVLSNIPVARRRVRLWDNDVLDIGGWPPMLSICGIGIVTIRYGDTLRFCVNCDDTTISKDELNFLLTQVAVEVQELSEQLRVEKITRSVQENEGKLQRSLSTYSLTSDITELSDDFIAVPRKASLQSFEESFLHNMDGTSSDNKGSIKFRFNNSLNTIKDSLNKLREP